MASVTLAQLEKVYPPSRRNPAFRAVKGVDLEIRDGELMVLVGPSGCGKSTVLRMIAGLEEITAGTITIGDQVVNELAPKDRGIAMVFQNYALYPHMSVFDNLAFGLKLARTPRAEIDRRVREAAAILGLDGLLDRKPAALSGGQRQRVAVGRAIVRQPRVFLFDEPLSNLDAKMRVVMRTEIARLHDRLGTTMIYVTHDQIEAMTMGDRICVMRDGEIMQVADPLTLYHRPDNAYVAGFIGTPPMNLLRGRIERQDGAARFVAADPAADPSANGSFTLALPAPVANRAPAGVGEVLLGLRPESLHEQPAEGRTPLRAHVELAEPMGAETYLHLRAGPARLIARLHTTHDYDAGAEVTVHVQAADAHLFDATTERVLR